MKHIILSKKLMDHIERVIWNLIDSYQQEIKRWLIFDVHGGDDEKPVEVPDGEDAWQFMFELVVKEAKIECQDHCDEGELKIIPKEDSLELHYMDGEICYYTII